jgi:phosphate/sulfate permease
MDGGTCCTSFINVIIAGLFSLIGLVVGVACIEMKGAIEFDETEVREKNWWVIFSVFLNSIVVAILTYFFSKIAEYIVDKENHNQASEKEDSLITISFWMSCFVSFSGLFLYCYWQQDLALVNLLMIFLILFKQILLNLVEAG